MKKESRQFANGQKAPYPLHIPVLLKEAVAALNVTANGVYVDGTFGAGGYTRAILDSNPTCRVIAIDRDETAIDVGTQLKAQYGDRLTLIHGCFSQMDKLITESVDGVVLDIGVSSMQIDTAERGFSFQKDGALDMRMDRQRGVSAADVVNTFAQDDIADILFRYGQEKASRRIAQKIVASRPLTTTLQLAEVVRASLPYYHEKINPATRTFQALRIYVNDELGELERGLNAAQHILKPNGILAVVSFHSLEDKIIKNFMRTHSGLEPNASRYMPEIKKAPADFHILTKKAISATIDEIAANPRARSARLRVMSRIKQ